MNFLIHLDCEVAVSLRHLALCWLLIQESFLSNPFQVAVIQAGTNLFDLDSTIKDVEDWTAKAAQRGAQVILFPEAFVGGYPRGLGFGTVVGDRSDQGRDLWLRYSNSCPVVDGPELDTLGEIAARYQVFMAIGVVERSSVGGSLYCSVLYYDSDGRLVGRHRKLKPTAAERIIWSDADPKDSMTVVDSKFGKIGGLICWENYMPLARMAIYQQGVEIYVAPTADQRDRWQNSMIHIALEGRCFVLSSNQFVTKSDYPTELHQEIDALPEVVCRGGSMIVSPSGNVVAEPLWGEPGMLIESIDIGEVQKAKMDFDPIGHYARNDAFEFRVRDH